ncbi:MFS transporter [Terrirubrum flagellatum]|uniref:MFS transporter n=1 Tax=Terrirubrum flagellatum TaxID=2895980 RepID=UPI003CC822F4
MASTDAGTVSPASAPRASAMAGPAFAIVLALSFSHGLNDLVQSLLPAIYPIVKDSLDLNFSQIGLITFAFQVTASLLQPFVGVYTDAKPMPFSLTLGMFLSLIGLLMVATAHSFGFMLIAGAMIGAGSSIFHPEASRVARMASGGRHGFTQSVFQVGGNAGQAIGPLLAALIVVPHGQASVSWFAGVALFGMALLGWVGVWYRERLRAPKPVAAVRAVTPAAHFGRSRVVWAIVILLALTFSKNFYMSSFSSYYTFYLIHHFGLSVQDSQLYLFIFGLSIAIGTLVGGWLGDKIGRLNIMWLSIVGVLPFTVALPYVGLPATIALSIIIGFLMASAFPAIIVFAQELVPGRVGMIGGLFFGMAFGMGGLGAAVLGILADATSIEFAYKVCSYLPAIGFLTAFLPRLDRLHAAPAATSSGARQG